MSQDVLHKIKSNQIFICSNERSEKIDNNSDIEQDSKAQEALTAALVNNSKNKHEKQLVYM